MIGTVVTLCIALTVLVHGVHSARHAKSTEDNSDRSAIERAQTHVRFLDLVDGWATVSPRCVPVVAELDRSLHNALDAGDRPAAAVHARELLTVLAPFRRVDIVDA